MKPSRLRHPAHEGQHKTSSRPKRWMLKAGCLFLAALLLASSLAHAQTRGLTFIRDAEIEHYLRTLGAPVFIAADLDPKSVNVAIIQDNAVNAFVAGGMNIFFYTGLLMTTETPQELQGVIAHETGHIAGGHLMRGSEAMKNASAQAIIGMLAGLAVGAAAGRGDIAIGAIGAGQTIAERTLLSFSRAQESSADSAAMRFLDRAGEPSDGLLAFMEKLGKQELLPLDRRSEYVRTHPLSQDRIQNIKTHVESTKRANPNIRSDFVTQHERMKAKLSGYLQPESALLKYTDKDPRLPARYARAIALYRKGLFDRALPLMDGLIASEPANPFFHELKGQMLFESGRVNEAVVAYEKSVALLADSALLRVAYAHALLEQKDPKKLDLAIHQLTEANRLESRNPQTWRFLAAAWRRKGELTGETTYQGLVSYAFAEESLAEGNDKKAKEYADRALKTLPKGTGYWLRAQDIKLTLDDARKD